MNEKIAIISDGSCDLSSEEIKNLDLTVVPFYVSFDSVTYLKENVDIKTLDFYQKMIENPNVFPKTSLPTVQDYVDVFKPIVESGKSIICICITTKFSGSYNSAQAAKSQILEEYKDAKIEVIDAIVNTCLQGLLVKEVCRMRDDNLSFDEIIENANRIKKTARIFFTVGSLDYLRHGGRIGKLIGLVGATLRIKPLIVLKEGEIFSCGLCFSRKKSMIKIVDLVKKHFLETKENPNNYRFVVGTGYTKDEQLVLQKRLCEVLQRDDIELGQIGATIGVHTGPYPLGVGLIKKYDH